MKRRKTLNLRHVIASWIRRGSALISLVDGSLRKTGEGKRNKERKEAKEEGWQGRNLQAEH